MEALDILGEVSVPDFQVHAARLRGGRMGRPIVVGGFVEEALAMQVHFQEGLRAGVELARRRQHGLAALEALLRPPRFGARLDGSAVEYERG